MGLFLSVLGRDLRLALRQSSDSLIVVGFFVVTVVLFPFGVGPEVSVLERISAGVLWVTALLASMLSLDRIFQQDYEDGSLDLLTRAPAPLTGIVLAKILAHWLTTALPLVVAAPVLAVLLQMSPEGFSALVAALLLGTPTLSLIGAVGAALVLGARRGGVLVSLLILPLYVPVLIFGVSAVDGAASGFAVASQFQIMGAILLVSLVVCPLAAAMALRQALE
ncbi:heme exporter protein CcmB [Phaeovibrio sulfidiphilus]|uniref:Heme exporter protein B n=1 Tax=Phaeovibrio sulfidiphilus TaxID=1220600 RepID=A0A8J6YUI3_9PROT|nr:heme exporter protein CcmB [Phaeovibrio sulfidiphilus]MBE1236659.1 heme exporter protein CcmB [Phaeovibrio sulfidiphilus]